MKPFAYIRCILAFLAIGLGVSVQAEHIIGGEIYYVCNADGSQTFTMKLYRDCNGVGAPFDNPASFSVYDDDGFLVDVRSAFLSSSSFINDDFDSPCLNLPPNICVEEGVYEFTLNLNTANTGYQVVYQRCCRNPTVQNLLNPSFQGLTIVAEVPQDNVAECNSSPVFNNFPPPVLCAFEDLVFDHSATDPDGDELVYSLCAPYTGGTQTDPAPNPATPPPYTELMFTGPYSAAEPLTADPMLSIDPNTGLLTGQPTLQGQFVVGVCVEEYRNGVLIGVNKRDFQFNVQPCDPVSEVIIQEVEEAELCDDLTFNFTNLGDPTVEYVWDYGDPTTENDITIGFNGFYTFPDTGTYTITVVSSPGAFCSDTSEIVLPVFNETTVDIAAIDFECVNDQQVFSFTADGNFDQAASTVNWNFGAGATPATGTGLTVTGIVFDSPGDKSIQVEAINNVCQAQNVVTIEVAEPTETEIEPQGDFCQGFTIPFFQNSVNATNFIWEFGDPSTDGDVSNNPNPSYTYPGEGLYTVTLTAFSDETCPVSTSEVFEVRPLLAPAIPAQDVFCFDDHSIDFTAAGSYTADAVFQWSFDGGTPGSSSSENPSGVTFDSPGEKLVTLTVSENNCERTAESTIDLHPNPVAAFQVFPNEGCVPLSVTFLNESITESSSRAFDWDFGDGGSSNGVNTTHEYTSPGTYSVSLFLENLNGCLGTSEVTQEDVITVNPSPNALFDFEPKTISVLDPVIEITDLSEGNILCNYYFDDRVFDDCSFVHTVENLVPQTIRLVVQNEFGCVDEIETEVFLEDHLIFIPNAFTPDGDGINDLFRPVMEGVLDYQMWIFDRWGSEIFYTDDRRGWDGQGAREDYYIQNQEYTYRIVISEYNQRNYEYFGSVRLIR